MAMTWERTSTGTSNEGVDGDREKNVKKAKVKQPGSMPKKSKIGSDLDE
jgi:hypothetical protein